MRNCLFAIAVVLGSFGCDERPKDEPAEVAAETKAETKAEAPGITHGPEAPPVADGAERWHAVAQIGMDQVELLVDFAKGADDSWTATLGVPRQEVWGVPLQDVSLSNTEVRFTLHKPEFPQADEVYVAKRESAGAEAASGTMTLGGQEFTFTMKKVGADGKYESAIKRPQTPKAPFPYETRELVATNAEDGTKRAGTLSVPKGKGPFPVVIIESGSGPHDRDGTFAGHKPYLVIGDHLTRAGIAVLRTDDRGVGSSTGVDKDASYEDLTGDLLAMVDELKKQPEIDASRIGAIGHSQGGTVAPMAAARSKDLAFVVLLAGMGVKGYDVMVEQKRLVAKSQGIDGKQLDEMVEHQRKMLTLVLEDADEATLRKAVEDSLAVDLTEEQRSQLPPQAQAALVENGLASLQAQFIRSLIRNDPADYLPEVKVPVLAIFGEKDLQVEPVSNEAGIKKHVPHAETWIVPKMSHNLQQTETGNIEEYGRIEQTVRPDVLARLVAFIESTA